MNLLINHRFIFNRLHAPLALSLCVCCQQPPGDEMGGRTDAQRDYAVCCARDAGEMTSCARRLLKRNWKQAKALWCYLSSVSHAARNQAEINGV
jgi:hypothetical protein